MKKTMKKFYVRYKILKNGKLSRIHDTECYEDVFDKMLSDPNIHIHCAVGIEGFDNA